MKVHKNNFGSKKTDIGSSYFTNAGLSDGGTITAKVFHFIVLFHKINFLIPAEVLTKIASVRGVNLNFVDIFSRKTHKFVSLAKTLSR